MNPGAKPGNRKKIHPLRTERAASPTSRSAGRRARIKIRKKRFRILLTGILAAAAVFFVLLLSDSLMIRVKKFDGIRGNEESGENMDEKDWQLVLVNSSNPLESNYKIQLKTVQGSHKVDKRIAGFVSNMIDDAKRDGVSLLICSSYRSVSRQQELFDDEVNKYISAGSSMDEALAEAAYGVAVPGHSEHSTGLALDIVAPEYQTLDSGFEKTDTFKWLNENAHKYGFILRYPKDKTDITKIKYEPWHYRFVGLENAERIFQQGICLEEYIQFH